MRQASNILERRIHTETQPEVFLVLQRALGELRAHCLSHQILVPATLWELITNPDWILRLQENGILLEPACLLATEAASLAEHTLDDEKQRNEDPDVLASYEQALAKLRQVEANLKT